MCASKVGGAGAGRGNDMSGFECMFYTLVRMHSGSYSTLTHGSTFSALVSN